MKWNESITLRGLSFGCWGVLLSIYIRLQKRAALAWRKFPICHNSQHAPLPLALYFRICPWAGQGGYTWEQYSGQTVFTGLFLNQPKPQRCSQAACSRFTHWARNNCGRRAHKLLGQLSESEETRFLAANNHQNILSPQIRFLGEIQFNLLNLLGKWFRCLK